jgi:hypothetical protein
MLQFVLCGGLDIFDVDGCEESTNKCRFGIVIVKSPCEFRDSEAQLQLQPPYHIHIGFLITELNGWDGIFYIFVHAIKFILRYMHISNNFTLTLA